MYWIDSRELCRGEGEEDERRRRTINGDSICNFEQSDKLDNPFNDQSIEGYLMASTRQPPLNDDRTKGSESELTRNQFVLEDSSVRKFDFSALVSDDDDSSTKDDSTTEGYVSCYREMIEEE